LKIHKVKNDNNCDLLAKEFMKKKWIQNQPAEKWKASFTKLANSDNSIEQIATTISSSKITASEYAPYFFDSFHQALLARQSKDVVSFSALIKSSILKLIPQGSREELAKAAIQFLCSPLNDQHRASLSILALCLPITFYLDPIFKLRENFEIQVLVGLHTAALQLASYLP